MSATTTSPMITPGGVLPAESMPPAVVLRGSGAGLEILLSERASVDEVIAALGARLESSPGFFTGCDVTLRLNGAKLPAGALTRIEALTSRYGLRIAEVRGGKIVASTPAAAPAKTEPVADPPGTARLHVGPVRSGVVLEAPGDLVVLGDVNAGAEVRARGNITVMGTLRGVAHAAYGRSGPGYVVALKLAAPQVRIGTLIARAGDADEGARGAEIAYATGERIVVENYQGKLPAALAGARR